MYTPHCVAYLHTDSTAEHIVLNVFSSSRLICRDATDFIKQSNTEKAVIKQQTLIFVP